MGIEIYTFALILLGIAIIWRIYRSSSNKTIDKVEQDKIEQYHKMRKHASDYRINYDHTKTDDSYFN